MIIVCHNCSASNRVPVFRLAESPICGRCKARLLPGLPIALTEATFPDFIGKNQLPVVVDFWAGWCAPCKMMAPLFAAGATDYATRILFAKVDTEAQAALAQRFGIRSIPTLILFRNGVEADRVSGALNASQLRTWLDAASA